MKERLKEVFDALNPWYFLYLFAVFTAVSLSKEGCGLTWFLSGLNLGLYIKNRDAWRLW